MEYSTQNRKRLFWNRKMITVFIELYKESVCLYDMSHENYNNHAVRTNALKNIVQKMQEYQPNLELEDVQNKIEVVHTQLAEEASLAENLGDNYVPKMWCYDQLEFLRSHMSSSTKINDSKENNSFSEYSDDAQSDDFEASLYTEFERSKPKYLWSRQSLKFFIKLFKKYNILYDPKHKDYLKTASKCSAYTNLLKETKQIDPQINLDDVRTKIQSLRSQYVRELRQIKKAQRNNEAYTPKLWCFKMLANLYNDEPEIISYYNLNYEEMDSTEKSSDDAYSQEYDDPLETGLKKSESTLKYEWKRKDMKAFIRLYKKYNILHDPKHKNYLKTASRCSAYSNLLKEMKQIEPQINLDDVRIKVQSLRSQYLRELRQIKKAQRNNEAYTPKLWCFKMLANLYNDELEIKSYYNLNNEQMINANILTTMNLTDATSDQYSTINIEKLNSEEIPQVIDESEIDHEESVTLSAIDMEKNNESALNTMVHSPYDNTFENDTEEDTDNNETDSLDANIENLVNNRGVQKYEWLGDLVESQLEEILPAFYTEFAWDVQCLIRKYVLKTKQTTRAKHHYKSHQQNQG